MMKAIDTTKRSYLIVASRGGPIAHIERRASSPGDGMVLCSRPMIDADFEEWDNDKGTPPRICSQCREIERRMVHQAPSSTFKQHAQR